MPSSRVELPVATTLRQGLPIASMVLSFGFLALRTNPPLEERYWVNLLGALGLPERRGPLRGERPAGRHGPPVEVGGSSPACRAAASDLPTSLPGMGNPA